MRQQSSRMCWIALWVVLLFSASLSTACGDKTVDIDEIDKDPDINNPDDDTPPTPLEERAIETWNFLDEHGRVIIPRGVNYSGRAKDEDGLPWGVDDTMADADHFAELGFNTIRYIIQWKNIEPTKDNYDDNYLKDVRERLDILHDSGLYVILDMHQDVYGPKFGYNGAPDWAVNDNGIEYVQGDGIWSMNYFHRAVQAAFDNFFRYDKDPSLQDAYVAMWKHTVDALGDHPAVLGYDIMNEPHPGSLFSVLEMGVDKPNGSSARFDRDRLGPFYQRVINGIREVDANGWILYEPRYGAPGDGGKQYMDKLDDPRDGESRLFGAPHLYILNVEASFNYNEKAAKRVAKWQKERESEREEWYAGVYLGEFGTYDHVTNYEDYMNDVVAVTEAMRIGFAAWSWDPWEFAMIGGERDADTNRFPEGKFLNHISRPYPRAFAGVPEAFSFDPETEILEVEWSVDASIDAPTEFFMARKRWYENGWELELEPEEGVSVTVEHEDDLLEQVFITVDDNSIETVKAIFRPAAAP